jgi:hypothetical protein
MHVGEREYVENIGWKTIISRTQALGGDVRTIFKLLSGIQVT